MARFHYTCLAELAHQLKLSPARLRLRQMDAAERLVDLIDPAKNYPYDFICHQITGYRPKGGASPKSMQGKLVTQDLVQLVEELSTAPLLPAGTVGPCWTTEELAGRLKVSTKTICRWRERGLVGRRMRFDDGSVRLAFLDRTVRRFIHANFDLVKRGAAFSQLSADEKQQIIDLAREILAEKRVRLHELSQLIAARVGRAVETVRYTLRRWDAQHPEDALFSSDDQPRVRPEHQAIHDAVRKDGLSIEAAAARFGRSVACVEAIVLEVRARLLKSRPIDFIHNAEFEAAEADAEILTVSDDPEATKPKRIKPPKDLPPYLQDLYRQPLLTPQQERDFFRRYNYLKFKAHRLREELDVLNASAAQLDAIEELLTQAEEIKNQILRANLRLVVSIARRHVGRSACFFEVVSDGNLALMRAVEKFDYARGFKFSTYASWAVMRSYARTIPEQMYESARLITGNDEMLAAVPDRHSVVDWALDGPRALLAKGLSVLNERERDIVVRHYGLDTGGEGMTLDQIGRTFGVTKERVRQIERKALQKLREAFGADAAQFARE